MPPNLDSPVQTQMAVSALNRPLTTTPNPKSRTEGRLGWKRVFVQTDTGCVLGIELDRGDNAHTVKRKLQLAFNLPTEETSLSYGDKILKNDLTSIRNDSALLLTRNLMHRSSSTPCLSPTGRDLGFRDKDRSGPIEILGCSFDCDRMKQVIKDVVKAIKIGVDPIPVRSGMGGAYYFQNTVGESVAIAKPTDEEPFAPNNPKGFVGKTLGQPGLKRSVRVGETGYREVAAYLLDYEHFANVPPTVLVKITHSVFHVNEGGNGDYGGNKGPISKIASFQQFIQHDFDASDYGTSGFPVTAVHRIGILDIRIFNTDRHAGNLLVRKVNNNNNSGTGFGTQLELVPIDHGLCLPESLEDPYFEWIHWPQSSIPFSEEEIKYVEKLDPFRDAEMLRMELPMIREACTRVLIVSTVFLKKAVGFGLNLMEIGEMMSREFTGGDEEPSELEMICLEAIEKVNDEMANLLEDSGEDEVDFIKEELKEEVFEMEEDPVTPKSPRIVQFCNFSKSRNPLSKLDESPEEEEESEEEIDNNNNNNNNSEAKFEKSAFSGLVNKWVPSITKLSSSFKGFTLKGKDVIKPNNSGSSTLGNSRSANEQMQTSASFVKLGDLSAKEWEIFLGKFEELLPEAFEGRKSGPACQKQRLGTSCQF